MQTQHNHNGHKKIHDPDHSVQPTFRSKDRFHTVPAPLPEEMEELRTTIEENVLQLARIFGLSEKEGSLLAGLALYRMGTDPAPFDHSSLEILTSLTPTAPLIKYGLVENEEELSLPEKVFNFLLGHTDLDRWLTDYVQQLPAPSPLPPGWESLSRTMGEILARSPGGKVPCDSISRLPGEPGSIAFGHTHRRVGKKLAPVHPARTHLYGSGPPVGKTPGRRGIVG